VRVCQASDVLGTSGRAILAAMVGGTTDTSALADLAQGRLRDKRASLARAVAGCMGAHQRFLLAEQLAHYDALNQSIDRVSAEIAERVHRSSRSSNEWMRFPELAAALPRFWSLRSART
jgi:transposase